MPVYHNLIFALDGTIECMTEPEQPTPVDQLAALSALGEPSRRELYDYIASVGGWVGRDEAADAAGIQRGVAAHHLDRLADEGLLEVDYQRLTGRTGPGAGRPAKVYRRSRADFEITLPPRDYEFAGRLLADAIADAQTTGRHVSEAVDHAATSAGRLLGKAMIKQQGRGRSAASARKAALAVLSHHGFEPHEEEDGTVVLRNCPFHLLAKTHTDLVCGMNHCLIDAAIAALDGTDFDVSLEPDPELCCVRLRRR